jgi:glutamate dehydrogenase/leucine dehydrogenase
VIPALLADFGSMFASYCEWRKNTRAGFSEHESLRGLSCHIAETWREVYEYADEYETDLRRAAMAIGVSRMAEALRMR